MTRKEEITLLIGYILFVIICTLCGYYAYTLLEKTDFVYHKEQTDWKIILYCSVGGAIAGVDRIIRFITYKLIK